MMWQVRCPECGRAISESRIDTNLRDSALDPPSIFACSHCQTTVKRSNNRGEIEIHVSALEFFINSVGRLVRLAPTIEY